MPRNRRRRSGSPVSFFAFQDIITAVSGIFIVILLLLTLELIQRPTLAQPVTVTVNSDLTNAVAETRIELKRLESELADSDQLIRELSQLTPKETQRQIRVEKQNIGRLEQELERLKKQCRQLTEAKNSIEVEHFDQKDDRKKLDELQRHIEKLDEELNREQSADRPLFTLPRGVSKIGWVVVVTGKGIQAAPMNRAQKPLSFTGDANSVFSDSPTDQFTVWARKQDRQSAYLLLLLRPSGLGAFGALNEKLTDIGVAFGFDLIGADEIVLNPVRGAVP